MSQRATQQPFLKATMPRLSPATARLFATSLIALASTALPPPKANPNELAAHRNHGRHAPH